MKYCKSALFTLFLLWSMIINTFSQSQFQIHLGAAMPLNKFGAYQINYDNSSAVLGWNVGLQYSYGRIYKDFGVFGGIDYIHNDISREFKETVEHYDTSEQLIFHTYTSVPITVGTNYTYELNDIIKLGCDLGLSINIFKISDFQTFLFIHEADYAIGIGGTFGINMTLKDLFSISLNYKGLGKHDINGTITYYESNRIIDFNQDISIHMLTLTLGLKF